MIDSTPMISANDADLILEESSLQEAADEAIQDTNELTHETASVIEETIDVINSTEEIEAAENAGLLSAIAVKAYSNRVNSYLDKLESRYIITKDDKLKPGLQFDNPQAGLLSIGETLKAAVRKVIEWISKAIAYLFNFTDLVSNKISQFISSRAGVSKKLREKLNSYRGYDIKTLGSHFRSIILLKNRYGDGDISIGCSFFGNCNLWHELPRADEINDYEKYITTDIYNPKMKVKEEKIEDIKINITL